MVRLKKIKEEHYEFPTKNELIQYDREMEIVSHPKVKVMVSEIRKCVYQFDRMKKEEMWVKSNALVDNINKELRAIEAFCKEHGISINICVYYPGIYNKATHRIAPAFIYYSLKRGCLVVIDNTIDEEWGDPDDIFEKFDSGYLTKDWYVNLGFEFGKVDIQDGMVRIGKFVTQHDLPNLARDYIAHLHHLLEQNNIEVTTEYI